MKPVLALFAILALTISTAAIAQSRNADPTPVAANDRLSGWDAGQRADQDITEGSGDSAGAPVSEVRPSIVLARAAGRGPRGRAIARPRGRARTFAYRGRNLTIIRRPAFVYPRGFAYTRWRAGQLLPLAFLAAPFFFLEYQALGLQAPPPGYRWVRYGPDVVLVNERTREIEDVAYGAIDDDDGD